MFSFSSSVSGVEELKPKSLTEKVEVKLRAETLKRLDAIALQGEQIKTFLQEEPKSDISLYAIAYSIVLIKELMNPSDQKIPDSNFINQYLITSELSKNGFTSASSQIFSFTSQPIIESVKTLLSSLTRVRDLLVDHAGRLDENSLKSIILKSAEDLAVFSKFKKSDATLNISKIETMGNSLTFDRQQTSQGSPKEAMGHLLALLSRYEELQRNLSTIKSASEKTKYIYAMSMIFIMAGQCARTLQAYVGSDKCILPLSEKTKLNNNILKPLIGVRDHLAHYNFATQKELKKPDFFSTKVTTAMLLENSKKLCGREIEEPKPLLSVVVLPAEKLETKAVPSSSKEKTTKQPLKPAKPLKTEIEIPGSSESTSLGINYGSSDSEESDEENTTKKTKAKINPSEKPGSIGEVSLFKTKSKEEGTNKRKIDAIATPSGTSTNKTYKPKGSGQD